MDRPEPPLLRIETSDLAVRHVRRERWLGRFGLVATWAGGVALISLASNEALVSFTFVGMLIGTAALIGYRHGVPVAGVRARGRPGSVTIDEDGVTLEIARRGRRHLARGEIASGWTERFASGIDNVVLQTRSGETVRWRVDDPADARAALTAAGVAPSLRAVTLRLGVAGTSRSRFLLVFLALLLAPFMLIAFAAFLGSIIAATFGSDPVSVVLVSSFILGLGLLATTLLVRPLITSTVRIGTDGIGIERLFRRRFVPRALFLGASEGWNYVAISTSDGAVHRVPVSSSAEAHVVVQRIQEAMANRGDAAASKALSRLARNGRPIAAWLRDVRAEARGAGGYREARLDPAEIHALVEDGAAPAERRIAAAAALSGSDEGKRRVRIAAEACADERLRLAIQEAAEDEVNEGKIEKALRAAEARA